MHLKTQYAVIESVQYGLKQFSGDILVAVLPKKILFAAGQSVYTDKMMPAEMAELTKVG